MKENEKITISQKACDACDWIRNGRSYVYEWANWDEEKGLWEVWLKKEIEHRPHYLNDSEMAELL